MRQNLQFKLELTIPAPVSISGVLGWRGPAQIAAAVIKAVAVNVIAYNMLGAGWFLSRALQYYLVEI
jgi:hypothetical protein